MPWSPSLLQGLLHKGSVEAAGAQRRAPLTTCTLGTTAAITGTGSHVCGQPLPRETWAPPQEQGDGLLAPQEALALGGA